MDNQELFVKITGLFDEKLTPVMQYLVIIDRRLEAVEQDVAELKQDVAVLKKEMKTVKQDVVSLKQQVNNLETRMLQSERNMEEVKQRLQAVEEQNKNSEQNTQEVKQRLRVVEEQNRKSALITENEILPRLHTIESCYLDTYKRYQNGSEDIQSLKQDMEIVKVVVSHHSEQLKQIS